MEDAHPKSPDKNGAWRSTRPNDEGAGRRRRTLAPKPIGAAPVDPLAATSESRRTPDIPIPVSNDENAWAPMIESATRPNDEGVGRRRRKPPSAEVIDQHENEKREATEKAKAAMKQLRSDALIMSASLSGKGFGALALIALMLGCVVLFFAFTQLVSVVDTLSNAPAVFRWIGWGGLGVLLVAMGWVAVRLTFFWRSLRPGAPIPRMTIHNGTVTTLEAVQGLLQKFLDDYVKLLDAADASSVHEKLIGDAARAQLREEIRYLHSDVAKRSGAWIDEFDRRFLGVIDQRVDAVIKARAKMLAYQTALAPGRGLDTLLALYHAGCMLGEIALLYNQRMNRRQVPGVLLRIVLQTGVAGSMEKTSELLAEVATDLVLPQLGNAGAAIVARTAGAKAGEALGNYLFAFRLGHRIKEALRPLEEH